MKQYRLVFNGIYEEETLKFESKEKDLIDENAYELSFDLNVFKRLDFSFMDTYYPCGR